MAATFNIKINVEGILNGKFVDFGEIFAPFTIATTNDIKVETDVTVAAGATIQIAAMGSVPAFLVLATTADGILAWTDLADTGNSSIKIPANTIIFLPSGVTTTYTATGITRADYANITDMKGLYFDANGAGKVSYLLVG